MARTYIYNERKMNLQNYLERTKECETVLGWSSAAPNECAPFERISFVGLGNSTSTRYHHNTNRKNPPPVAEYCAKMPESYASSSCFRNQNGIPTSMIDSTNDLRSSNNILNEWNAIHCKMNNLSRKLRSKTFQDAILDQVISIDVKRVNRFIFQ